MSLDHCTDTFHSKVSSVGQAERDTHCSSESVARDSPPPPYPTVTMPSSFPKHHSLHRFITFFAAVLSTACFMIIMRKECNCVPVSAKDFAMLSINETVSHDFIDHYYDTVQIFHIIVFSVDLTLFFLTLINIAPGQEDIRFGFHLVMIITLGGITILTFYTTYTAFYLPCLKTVQIEDKLLQTKQIYQPPNSKNSAGKINTFTVFSESDFETMLVCGLDLVTAFFFLLSTLILCRDAREEAIQDEYVARVRASIY